MASTLLRLLRILEDKIRKANKAKERTMNDPCLLSEDERRQAEEAKDRTLRLLYDVLKKKESLLVEDLKEFGDQKMKYCKGPFITTRLVKELIRELKKVTFEKNTNPEDDLTTYAYVYPGSEDRTIYLCGLFWEKDPDSRSRQGTMLHEVSHFLGYGHKVQENSDRVKKSPQSMLCPLTTYSVASALTSDMDHPGTYTNDSYTCCCETSRYTVCEKSKMADKLRFIRFVHKVDPLWSQTWLEQKDTAGFCGQTVWIVGHSFIYWAERRAAERQCGINLSLSKDLVQVHWMGVRDQRWDGLLDQVLVMKNRLPAPDIIIIHLGGNDIGKVGTIDLVFHMKKSLMGIRRLFPDARLIFSEMLPRLLWLQSFNLCFCEQIRKRVNKCLSKFMPTLGGVSFRHNALEGGEPGLYRSDAVHLSESGLDIFNLDLQAMIEIALDGEEPELTPS